MPLTATGSHLQSENHKDKQMKHTMKKKNNEFNLIINYLLYFWPSVTSDSASVWLRANIYQLR